MSAQPASQCTVAIACGGTGGHLFPGLAVARELRQLGSRVLVLISPKEIDQIAARQAGGFEIVTLPAVGLTSGRRLAFAFGLLASLRASAKLFARERPCAVLAMGGFTSAGPVLAGRRYGGRIYLHESNTIPGRANRWLSWAAHRAFAGFAESLDRMHARAGAVTGTPVRPQFAPMNAQEARTRLGLAPGYPTVVVTGGSQGASGLNDLVTAALPLIRVTLPQVQFLHLTGANDAVTVREAYAQNRLSAVVLPFLEEMELALASADVVISRSGASSLAEMAAMRVPAILVPFPAATDNHQYYNARVYVESGAALLCAQVGAPLALTSMLGKILTEPGVARGLREKLGAWHQPGAARRIAEIIFSEAGAVQPLPVAGPGERRPAPENQSMRAGAQAS